MSLAVLADHMASKGRGPDSMLIHMSPREVQGLQALAMKHGGSLTINPDTGLPEAGFLDKLLPTILGAGLTLAGVPPNVSAMIVGGIQTVRTGDLGKGIQAGLGAYGGANLTSSMTAAGSSAIGSEAATLGAGIPADMAYNLTDAGVQNLASVDTASQAIDQARTAFDPSSVSPYEKLSRGFDSTVNQFKNSPMEALKSNAKNLGYAFGPAILSEMGVKKNMPQTVTQPGMIAPSTFDPYSGTFIAGTPYRAAQGGLMGLAAGGMAGYGDGDDVPRRSSNGLAQGGMYDFAQRSEPVVRMADGGVLRMANGTPPAMLTDEQLYQKTGSWEAAAAARDDQNRALNIYNDAQRLAAATAPVATATPAYFTANPDVAAAFAQNSYGMTPEAFAQTHYEKYGQAEGRALPSAAASYAAANNIDLTGNINQWVADNPFATAAQVSSEAKKYGVSDTDIQKALSANTNISDAARYALTHNMGLAGLQQGVLDALKANPNATQAQIDAAQKQYGLSNADIQSPFAHGYQIANEETAAASKYLQDNKDVARWISSAEGQDYVRAHPEFDAADIAWTHYQRYGKNEGRKWGLDKKIDKVVPTDGATIIPGVNDYGLGGTGTSGALESVYGPALPPGVSGAGITTVNPNGTITTRPNIPGIPENGFTGMTSMRDAYTRGGGSLGYLSPTYTKEQFKTKYEDKLTGGSKSAYDYLTGKTAYSATPYTETGEVMKPYAESVLGIPANLSKKMYLFDPATKQYKINPDYAIPTRDSKGQLSYALTNKDVTTFMGTNPADDVFYTWAITNNLSPEQIASATGMPISEVYRRMGKGKPVEKTAESTTTGSEVVAGGGEANGGLMKLAAGGMSARFNLGDYSDGGRLLRGPGDGVSDSIPATIGNKRPARLADGEFVVPARIVSELGNGSTEAGARKLYAMMDRIQKARRGTVGKGRVAKNSRSEKYLPA